MADTASQIHDASNAKSSSAPKDKNCPYCGQAFTSSSLGRHLDLYIKEKNPKPPDGIHDVDAIRKLRRGITRRHPRASVGRKGSTPLGTPRPSAARRGGSGADKEPFKSSAPKDAHYALDSALGKPPFSSRWETTDGGGHAPTGSSWEANDMAPDASRRASIPRSASRQSVQKAQLDMKRKLADAVDTARAAELALHELIASWRAAKQNASNPTTPFDFDPLSLDFPALTLQCLRPPPTLFSSTQHPTSTSWSVQFPGQREFGAMKSYFRDELRYWKAARASAAAAAVDETSANAQKETQEAVKRLEKIAGNLETQIEEHLQSAYAVWASLPAQRQQELWILELARGVGRKHKEAEMGKELQHTLQQENAKLKMQLEQVHRLRQQQGELHVRSSTGASLDRDLLVSAYEQAVKQGKVIIGFDMEDRNADLGTVVSNSIERWKNVISMTRATSAAAVPQKPLDQPAQTPGIINSPAQSQPSAVSQTPRQPTNPYPTGNYQLARKDQAGSEPATSAGTTSPPSVSEASDQDADAEMEDDDSFAIMHTSPMKSAHPPVPHQAALDVPRTRPLMPQQGATTPDMRFMMHNGASNAVNRAAMGMGRSMPSMNMSMQGSHLAGGDLGIMQQVRGDAMYME
ncbi:hypothetical protein RJ55_00888 [Drechmeria coniospora]|nr:hypothetical protein RJ55_00888 [Drechmeria coniospora]